MMSLRTRLLLGYGYLVMLIVLTAGGAAVGLFKLSNGISEVVENNFLSVNAASQMLGSLGRQDNATLRTLIDAENRQASRQTLREADRRFDEIFKTASNNATIRGEAQLLAAIARSNAQYRSARDALLDSNPQHPIEAYNLHVYKDSRALRAQIFELLDLNQKAIMTADKNARRIAVQNGVGLAVVVTLAFISLVALSRALQNHFLSRLAEFKEVSEAIAAGEIKRRFKPGEDDELGMLARHFNEAIDTQKHLRAEAQGRLDQQRQLLLGALGQRDHGAGLVGLDGAIIASTLEGDAQLAFQAHRHWVQNDGRERLKSYKTGTKPPIHIIEYNPDCTIAFELLVAQRRRPVGWLVQQVDAKRAKAADPNAPDPDAEPA